jgi:hypothetical protein
LRNIIICVLRRFVYAFNLARKIEEVNDDLNYSFVLAIFGDLKKYIFYYKFKEVNDGVEYQIKKITSASKFLESIRSELSSLKQLNYYEWKVRNQELLKLLLNIQESNNNIIIFDFSNNKHQIPNLLKNTLYCNISNDSIYNIILVKDSNLEEELKQSIILTVHAKKKENKFDITQTQSIIVDLKNLLNPYT